MIIITIFLIISIRTITTYSVCISAWILNLAPFFNRLLAALFLSFLLSVFCNSCCRGAVHEWGTSSHGENLLPQCWKWSWDSETASREVMQHPTSIFLYRTPSCWLVGCSVSPEKLLKVVEPSQPYSQDFNGSKLWRTFVNRSTITTATLGKTIQLLIKWECW